MSIDLNPKLKYGMDANLIKTNYNDYKNFFDGKLNPFTQFSGQVWEKIELEDDEQDILFGVIKECERPKDP